MLKTRIIKRTYGDGHTIYTPQYKRGWWGWFDYYKYDYFEGHMPKEFDTVEQAQKFIDKEIISYNKGLLLKKEIIKYP